VQVDAWGAFVPARANLVEQLREGVEKEVEARKLKNLEISSGEMGISTSTIGTLVGEKREYVFFNQKLGLSANATLALRIAPRGAEDLELSWRLLESNPGKTLFLGLSQGALVYLGFAVTMAGVILIIAGVGACVVPVGIWMMGVGLGWWGTSQNKSRLTAEQMLDARILAQTVDYCLMAQLDKLGVSSDELRVLQAAQMQGIGNLGAK
jgi:hypothetical protein